jgi:competence protein ComEC
LLRAWSLAPVDVLKVPHHGSRFQDARLSQTLLPTVALISNGKDNGYGHPAAETLAALRATGAAVWRTDTVGDLAVVRRAGTVQVVARG